jgi:hypothetical protein
MTENARTIRNQDVVVYAGFKSRSAFKLAEALSAYRWYTELPENFPSNPPRRVLVVNWGTGWPARWMDRLRDFRVLNSYRPIEASVDKRTTLRELRDAGVPTLDFVLSSGGVRPDYTTLERWLQEDGRVIVRNQIEGNNGHGITVARSRDQLGSAPLYTRFYPKTHEFRIHVWNGQVIDFKQKRLLNDASETRVQEIRSYDQGWIHSMRIDPFVTSARPVLDRHAIAAVQALGLHFGAIDMLARFDRQRFVDCKVCETNTAPDLTAHEETLDAYVDAIRSEYEVYTHRTLQDL